MTLRRPKKIKNIIIWLFLFVIFVFVLQASGVAYAHAPHLSSQSQSAEYTSLHNAFPKNYYGNTSTIYIQNPYNFPTDISYTFHGNTGTIEISETSPLPPKGTLIRTADDIPGNLPDGFYWLEVRSNQTVESVVQIKNQNAAGDYLSMYRSDGPDADFIQTMGLFLDNYGILVWNLGAESASVATQFITLDGTVETTDIREVNPGDQVSIYGPTVPGLPAGFMGWVDVRSPLPFVSLLYQTNLLNSDGYNEYQNALGWGSVPDAPYLPRAIKDYVVGGEARTTTLFIGNIGVVTANAALSFYQENGQLEFSMDISFPAKGAKAIDLGDISQLPSGGVWACTLTSDQPLVVGETNYEADYTYATGTYEFRDTAQVYIPRIVRSNTDTSVFYVFNPNYSELLVAVDFFDTGGGLVFSLTPEIPANGWERIDMSQMSQAGENFEGSVIVTADQPLGVWVDEYIVPASSQPTPTATLAITPTPTATTTPPTGLRRVFLPMSLRTKGSTYFEGPWEQEDNDSGSQANGPLRPDQDYYGYPDDDYDFFYFNTENTGSVSVDLSNHSGEAVQLQLFYQTATAENRLITVFDPPYHVELHDQPPGKYIVYIFTGAGYNNETPYTLRLGYP